MRWNHTVKCFFWLLLVVAVFAPPVMMPSTFQTSAYQVEEFSVHIVGERPSMAGWVDPGCYVARYEWVPGSLAVYLQGKRLHRHIEYEEYPSNRYIRFKCFTNSKSLIIIDYEKK